MVLQNIDERGTGLNDKLLQGEEEALLRPGDVITVVERCFRYENPHFATRFPEDILASPAVESTPSKLKPLLDEIVPGSAQKTPRRLLQQQQAMDSPRPSAEAFNVTPARTGSPFKAEEGPVASSPGRFRVTPLKLGEGDASPTRTPITATPLACPSKLGQSPIGRTPSGSVLGSAQRLQSTPRTPRATIPGSPTVVDAEIVASPKLSKGEVYEYKAESKECIGHVHEDKVLDTEEAPESLMDIDSAPITVSEPAALWTKSNVPTESLVDADPIQQEGTANEQEQATSCAPAESEPIQEASEAAMDSKATESAQEQETAVTCEDTVMAEPTGDVVVEELPLEMEAEPTVTEEPTIAEEPTMVEDIAEEPTEEPVVTEVAEPLAEASEPCPIEEVPEEAEVVDTEMTTDVQDTEPNPFIEEVQEPAEEEVVEAESKATFPMEAETIPITEETAPIAEEMAAAEPTVSFEVTDEATVEPALEAAEEIHVEATETAMEVTETAVEITETVAEVTETAVEITGLVATDSPVDISTEIAPLTEEFITPVAETTDEITEAAVETTEELIQGKETVHEESIPAETVPGPAEPTEADLAVITAIQEQEQQSTPRRSSRQSSPYARSVKKGSSGISTPLRASSRRDSLGGEEVLEIAAPSTTKRAGRRASILAKTPASAGGRSTRSTTAVRPAPQSPSPKPAANEEAALAEDGENAPPAVNEQPPVPSARKRGRPRKSEVQGDATTPKNKTART